MKGFKFVRSRVCLFIFCLISLGYQDSRAEVLTEKVGRLQESLVHLGGKLHNLSIVLNEVKGSLGAKKEKTQDQIDKEDDIKRTLEN